MGIGKDFRNRITIALKITAKMNKWKYMKLSKFLEAEESVERVKSQCTEWETNFPAVPQAED